MGRTSPRWPPQLAGALPSVLEPPPARPWSQPPAHRGNQPPTQPRLQSWTTTDLNAGIERYMAHLRQSGRLAADERTAWLVYDFTSRRYLIDDQRRRALSERQHDQAVYRPGLFQQGARGPSCNTRPFHRQRMEAMIQHSDNSATNYFIELLNRTSRRSGPAEAEHTLKQRHPGVFRQTRIVERIPAGGRSYRNKASALDYHRFLQAIWYDQLPYSGELKRLMGLPNRDRIYTGATGVARQTWVFDKTGTTARLCGDMGILVARGRDGRHYPYTFIGIIEKARPARNYVAWMNARGDVIREVSGMVYRHLRQMHDLV
ncbi:MAG: serine hydrolase [Candidatus Competibacteraceae bacterium]